LRHEGHEMNLKFMTARQASKGQHRLKEKVEKERNINCRRKGNWRKRKGRKDKDDGKESRETRCLIEGQQCCKPKIGGESSVTNKLSSESSKDQIQYRTMCERSIMWYCSQERLSSSF